MKVTKFGGSSLADAAQIKKVCEILLSDKERQVIVVSAPGKRFSSDIKVTDLLIALADAKIAGQSGDKELQAVLDRFSSICDELEIPECMDSIKESITESIKMPIKDAGRYMDATKALGEDSCARLVATYLNKTGHKATYCNPKVAGLLLETEVGGHVKVLPQSYDNLADLARLREICVFPGFFGYSEDGEIITFSRGGSDITGAILAAAVHATVYENWTDVDNVYAVNPNLVKDPFAVTEITYDEMRELAYAGFSVLHEEALYPAFVRGIPVNIRNTNHPEAKGTMIVAKRTHYDSLVTGIAGEKGFCALNMSKYLMNREVGFLVKVLSIIADEGISIEHMPSGIDSVSIILRAADFTPEKERRIVQRISLELNVDNISVNRDLAIVMIVGEAMANTVGTTARAATALSKAGINLELINQGASEISVMFGVREEYCSYAVRTLYKEFFG
ncbi:MAG: aspartate kinase [Saccharofermentanaceae bacterium]|nr:aspartate kinase [Saccharofermentanaceae bacterium]HBZ77145.1 aspartate kinase [Clostridiales bacterium]